MAEWMPIESAPKDGTFVIVWPPTWKGVVSCASWDDDKYAKKPRPYWRRADEYGCVGFSREKPPTHWMPLPEPPKETP